MRCFILTGCVQEGVVIKEFARMLKFQKVYSNMYEGSGQRSHQDLTILLQFIQLFTDLFWRVLHLARPTFRLFFQRLICHQLQVLLILFPQQTRSKEPDPHRLSGPHMVDEVKVLQHTAQEFWGIWKGFLWTVWGTRDCFCFVCFFHGKLTEIEVFQNLE